LQGKPFTLWRTAVDALAAGMLVTCLLDFWRIGVGGIVEGGGGEGQPWMPPQ
jgi:cycloeucalenol cycloisomerase